MLYFFSSGPLAIFAAALSAASLSAGFWASQNTQHPSASYSCAVLTPHLLHICFPVSSSASQLCSQDSFCFSVCFSVPPARPQLHVPSVYVCSTLLPQSGQTPSCPWPVWVHASPQPVHTPFSNVCVCTSLPSSPSANAAAPGIRLSAMQRIIRHASSFLIFFITNSSSFCHRHDTNGNHVHFITHFIRSVFRIVKRVT